MKTLYYAKTILDQRKSHHREPTAKSNHTLTTSLSHEDSATVKRIEGFKQELSPEICLCERGRDKRMSTKNMILGRRISRVGLGRRRRQGSGKREGRVQRASGRCCVLGFRGKDEEIVPVKSMNGRGDIQSEIQNVDALLRLADFAHRC